MFYFYSKIVRRYRLLFLILLIPLIIYFAPVGFDAFNLVEPDVGLENLGTDQEVASFTSFTDDIVFVIEGDEKLLSQAVWNWTAEFAFQLQNNEFVQKYAQDGTPIQHIFSAFKQILTPYYVSTHLVIGSFNVSTYLIINGTKSFVKALSKNYQNDSATALNTTIEEISNQLMSKLPNLAYGYFFTPFIELWIERIVTFVNDSQISQVSYDHIVQSWDENIVFWNIVDSPQLKDAFIFLLSNIDNSTTWSPPTINNLVSNFLYGEITENSIEFLNEIFENGNDPTKPVRISNQILIPFLRDDTRPYGFPTKVRDFYLQAFTNSNGSSLASSMLMRFRIRSDLNPTELSNLFREMERLVKLENEENPFGYKLALLSLLNYQRERENQISGEMHLVDLVAIVIGIIVLFIFIRNPIFTIIPIGIAYLVSLTSKGIIIKSQPIIGIIHGTALSMATTMLLGAALNYSVFFTHRYLQEREKDKDHHTAVKTSISRALHSVIISGFAVVLVLIPYYNSFFETLRELSIIVIVGMISQIILLTLILPTVFFLIEPASNYLKFSKISIWQPDIWVTPSNKHKILIVSLVLALLALLVLLSFESSIQVNDFIGDEGQTGVAMEIFEKNFPDNYLAKVLVSMHFNQPILYGQIINFTSMKIINDLTLDLNAIEGVSGIISPAWPLGSPFNFSDRDIGFVTYESSLEAAKLLVDENTNTSFIVIQLAFDATSEQNDPIVESIRKTINEFMDRTVIRIEYSGIPIEVNLNRRVILRQLPVQFLFAVLFLSIFLWWQLGSINVPIRLQFTILIGSLYGLVLTTIFYQIFFNRPLNLLIITSSVMILLGLGTDFDVYIYRRILEILEQGEDLYTAIIVGHRRSGGAIQLSGLIMAFSFLSLYQSSLELIRQFGLLTFIAILIDIFIVRLIIVPAILLLGYPEEK